MFFRYEQIETDKAHKLAQEKKEKLQNYRKTEENSKIGFLCKEHKYIRDVRNFEQIDRLNVEKSRESLREKKRNIYIEAQELEKEYDSCRLYNVVQSNEIFDEVKKDFFFMKKSLINQEESFVNAEKEIIQLHSDYIENKALFCKFNRDFSIQQRDFEKKQLMFVNKEKDLHFLWRNIVYASKEFDTYELDFVQLNHEYSARLAKFSALKKKFDARKKKIDKLEDEHTKLENLCDEKWKIITQKRRETLVTYNTLIQDRYSTNWKSTMKFGKPQFIIRHDTGSMGFEWDDSNRKFCSNDVQGLICNQHLRDFVGQFYCLAEYQKQLIDLIYYYDEKVNSHHDIESFLGHLFDNVWKTHRNVNWSTIDHLAAPSDKALFVCLVREILSKSDFCFINIEQCKNNLYYAYAVNHALKFSMNFLDSINENITHDHKQYDHIIALINTCDQKIREPHNSQEVLQCSEAYIEIINILWLIAIKSLFNKEIEDDDGEYVSFIYFCNKAKEANMNSKIKQHIDEEFAFFQTYIDGHWESYYPCCLLEVILHEFDTGFDDIPLFHGENPVTCVEMLKRRFPNEIEEINERICKNEIYVRNMEKMFFNAEKK